MMEAIMMMMMMIVLIFLFAIVILLPSTAADPLANDCYGGNYTANSKYQSNLNVLLASLSSKNASYATDTQGSTPDRAYGLVLCRGNAGPAECQACLQNAAQDVVSLCPFSKQAVVWYDSCQLRYADFIFFSIVSERSPTILINVNNATDPDSFIEAENKLLDRVTYQAAYNSSDLKFATGIAFNGSASWSSSSQNKIYALMQCTRDLSTENCNRCLQDIHGAYKDCEMKLGGKVLGKSCNFRYEIAPFFAEEPTVSLDLSPPPPSPPPPPPSAGDNTGKGSVARSEWSCPP